jgi:hypothetical protein
VFSRLSSLVIDGVGEQDSVVVVRRISAMGWLRSPSLGTEQFWSGRGTKEEEEDRSNPGQGGGMR